MNLGGSRYLKTVPVPRSGHLSTVKLSRELLHKLTLRFICSRELTLKITLQSLSSGESALKITLQFLSSGELALKITLQRNGIKELAVKTAHRYANLIALQIWSNSSFLKYLKYISWEKSIFSLQ